MSVTGCAEKINDDYVIDIKIEAPICMSHNAVTLKNGAVAYVNIEMVSGRYFYDSLGGGVYGNNWDGNYQIRVCSDENGDDTIFTDAIHVGNEERMNFGGAFPLEFDDYNCDGNLDFTLGQWGSSNGNYFEIYTIYEDGTVSKLETGGEMFISSHEFSVPLEKLSETSFTYNFYDNSQGEWIERIFEWEEDRFVKAE